MSGELYKLKEQKEELVKHIKELEEKRLDNDTLNTKRLEPLYALLEGLDNAIFELEQGGK